MKTASICTDELWARGFGESHPLKPERLKRTYELLMVYRAFDAPNPRLVASPGQPGGTAPVPPRRIRGRRRQAEQWGKKRALR